MPKKMSVRQRLMDAAYAAMSAKGFEESRITDIIEASGVGVGSFYRNYSGKDDLARAVFANRVEEFGVELESVAKSAPEIAAATCFVFRRLLERAEEDSAWAGFILQLEPVFRLFDSLMRPHAREGLQIGIDNGTFQADDLEASITAIHSMMLSVTQAMLLGELSSERAHRTSCLALRLFRVDEERAQYLSRLPMADLHRLVKPGS